MRTVWIGTFPAAGAGTPGGLGEGIWRGTLADGELTDVSFMVEAPAPSFLAAHPSGRWVYAVSEGAAGAVTAFEVTDGLVERESVSSGGADPCHLALSPDARSLYVANYSSGTLAVIGLDADGAIEGHGPRQVLGFEGTGPDPERQEGPHAHFVAVPSANEVVVADLGTDVLRHYAVGVESTLRPADALELVGLTRLPPGTGPRHLAISPDERWWYVVGELDATLHVLESTPQGLASRQVLSLAGSGAERGEHGWFLPEGRLLGSHVELVGDRVFAGMRIDNRLEEFAVAGDGTLTPLRTLPLAGWPRHFAVVGPHVLVAGQTSDAIEILGPDGQRTEIPLPAPACVVLAPV
ncbi:MAG: lactonase family protein [Actinomycetota bacterium]|nr:lactonase family protein [Actinomycetota bacterium]